MIFGIIFIIIAFAITASFDEKYTGKQTIQQDNGQIFGLWSYRSNDFKPYISVQTCLEIYHIKVNNY